VIVGAATQVREAVITWVIQGDGIADVSVDAVIDIGFNGYGTVCLRL
jgi:predicted aspartyl protease